MGGGRQTGALQGRERVSKSALALTHGRGQFKHLHGDRKGKSLACHISVHLPSVYGSEISHFINTHSENWEGA